MASVEEPVTPTRVRTDQKLLSLSPRLLSKNAPAGKLAPFKFFFPEHRKYFEKFVLSHSGIVLDHPDVNCYIVTNKSHEHDVSERCNFVHPSFLLRKVFFDNCSPSDFCPDFYRPLNSFSRVSKKTMNQLGYSFHSSNPEVMFLKNEINCEGIKENLVRAIQQACKGLPCPFEVEASAITGVVVPIVRTLLDEIWKKHPNAIMYQEHPSNMEMYEITEAGSYGYYDFMIAEKTEENEIVKMCCCCEAKLDLNLDHYNQALAQLLTLYLETATRKNSDNVAVCNLLIGGDGKVCVLVALGSEDNFVHIMKSRIYDVITRTKAGVIKGNDITTFCKWISVLGSDALTTTYQCLLEEKKSMNEEINELKHKLTSKEEQYNNLEMQFNELKSQFDKLKSQLTENKTHKRKRTSLKYNDENIHSPKRKKTEHKY